MTRRQRGVLKGCIMLAVAVVMSNLAAPADAAWLEARSDHFRVYSEGTATDLTTYVGRLEQLDAAMRLLRAMPNAPSDNVNPLTIYIVKDVPTLRRLCSGGRRMMGCDNIAGFYMARAEGSVAFTPRNLEGDGKFALNAQAVLFHEYAHHFMLGNFAAAYPAWFAEGFAEFYSTADFGADGRIGIGTVPMHRALGALSSTVLPLPRMLVPNGRKLDARETDAMYGRGWALIHYLTFSKERAGQLATYLAGYGAGKADLAAAKTAFGDINTLERELYRYLRQSKLSYFNLPSTALPNSEIAIRQLPAGEAAMMPVRLRSKRGVDSALASEVVLEARKLAAPYPDDREAQEALAEAEYDAGFDDNAEAAADRALKADPKARVAMIYKGTARLRRLTRDKAATAVAWKEARSWLIKANRLDPNDALPMLKYYDSFSWANERPTANAIDGLIFAFEGTPQDSKLRWLAGREYLLAGKLAEARTTLAPLAFDPHASADNPEAALIALIDRGDTAAIKAKLDEITKPSEKPAK